MGTIVDTSKLRNNIHLYLIIMSLGYPPLRPVPAGSTQAALKEDIYGVPNTMLHGQTQVKNDLSSAHPLQYTEQHWRENQEQMDFAMLRNLQGVHAPLRLTMERRTAGQMSRLPCLQSSNLLQDSLTGKLDCIEFDDVLNVPADAEVVGQPHALMERKLGLL